MSREMSEKEMRYLLRLLVLFDHDKRFPEMQRIGAGNLAWFASDRFEQLFKTESPIRKHINRQKKKGGIETFVRRPRLSG